MSGSGTGVGGVGEGPPAVHEASGGALTGEDVLHVARLSRLELAESEVSSYRRQLAAVLTHADRLRRLDLSGVRPLTSPLDSSNRLGADEPGVVLARSALMGMAPACAEPFVKVPKVLGAEAGGEVRSAAGPGPGSGSGSGGGGGGGGG